MLETISKGFSSAKNLLRKQTVLNDDNISSALKEVRLSLLEADVEYSVVKSFIERVRQRALGLLVKTSVTDKKGETHKLAPSEHFIGICYEELESLMGPENGELELSSPLSSFMMVGLQGSGKTTSSAKLARFLKEDKKKKPLLVAADIYRPGAFQQLALLGQRLDVPVFHLENESAQEICRQGVSKAKELKCDTIIFDTAGRLAVDERLMAELDDIKALVKPQNIYLVIDAMIGQDAVNTAKTFNDRLNVTGFILTKLDGDARGGAALSIKEVTKVPIKFLGLGEDLQSLEPFRAAGLASRILGMGDVVSLARDFEKHVDEKEAELDMKRMMRGSFSFDDFIKQLNMMRKIGSFQSIIERLPFMQEMLPGGAKIDDREFIKWNFNGFFHDQGRAPDSRALGETKDPSHSSGYGKRSQGRVELEQLLERFMLMRQMMAAMGKNPNAVAGLPMFKNMGRMAQIAKNYGHDTKSIMELMDGNGSPFGMPMSGPMPTVIKSKIPTKDKKDKRKQQKLARKKSKKRK